VNVTCGECQSVFRVDSSKVPAAGVRARCSVCGAVIRISSPADAVGAKASVGRATPTAPTPAAATGGWTAASDRAVLESEAEAAPEAFAELPAPPVAAPVPLRALQARPPLMLPPGAQPPVAPRARPSPPVMRPSPPSTPLAPLRPLALRTAPAAATPAPLSTQVVEPAAAAGAAAGTAGTALRKPVNPFLTNDPNLKARRLARALVSDMVAYLPDKREQGLREGTLRALFREEIKRSYEEYVDQMGREFVDSTTHFQEALNDLLAGGQKMF